MLNIKDYLLRRISYVNKRINTIGKLHGNKPNETHNYFGGWEKGYLKGKLSAYENILDKIEETNEGENNYQ